MATNRNIISIIAIERSFNDYVFTYGTGGRRRRGAAGGSQVYLCGGLQDVSEEARAFFGGDTVVWVGAVVEAPAGTVATFSFQD